MDTEVTKYRENEALNQSRLKEILKSPKSYKDYQADYSDDKYILGTLIDNLLLTGEIPDKYMVASCKIPTGKVKDVIDSMFAELKPLYLSEMEVNPETTTPPNIRELEPVILSHAAICEYGKSYKPDTIITKVIDGGEGYFRFLFTSVGKVLITEEEYAKAHMARFQCMESERVSKYFKDHPTVKFKNHYEIYTNLFGIPCKGELDKLLVFEKSKTIQIVDVKSNRDPLNFENTIFQLRYDFQIAFYYRMLLELVEDEKFEFYGYNVSPTAVFIVVDSVGNTPPFEFFIDAGMGISDYTKEFSNYVYQGVDSAIERVKFHESSQHWDFPMEYYKTKSFKLETKLCYL